jgi:hypothetical protein
MIDRMRQLFARALGVFLEREAENILNGTSERNLCARFAPILEGLAHDEGLVGYWADAEYNRKQGGRIKTIIDEHAEIVAITCDLILHSRGRDAAADNLIALEVKRREHPEREKEKDRVRLRALTRASYDGIWSANGVTLPEHVCGYVLGGLVELDVANRRVRVEEYVEGVQRGEYFVPMPS